MTRPFRILSVFTALLLFASVAADAQRRGRIFRSQLPPPVEDSDYHNNGSPNEAKVELGRMLFFDKVLSGNMNISCATCHHSLTDTGDGLSLPVGEGANGLGVTRNTGLGANAVHERVPRNAPPIFNLGAREFVVMFHDGRLFVDPTQPSGFFNPAGDDLPQGLDNVLAAQAMFPVTSGTEMAGQPGENLIADLADAGDLPALWDELARRLRAIPEYVDMFKAAYPDLGDRSFTYVHAANAIAAFEAEAWRADDSLFDRFLRGERQAMSGAAVRGAAFFYGKAGCARCHSGSFMTDHQFHAIAMPQIGPGKGDDFDGHSDFGLERVTLDPGDRYKFRTPTLRNVALTGPWGHAGAYDTLRAMVEHHLDPVEGIYNYDQSQAVLPSRPDLDAIDFIVMNDPARVAEIAAANTLAPVQLTDQEIDALIDFLNCLTGADSVDLRIDVPQTVPSGLPVFE